MKAVVLAAPRHVEVVDDWPEPAAGPDDVVVAIRGVGLCGTDLGLYDGKRAVPARPWVIGHEGGGEIVAVGSRVTNRHVGQRVVVEPNYCCLTCPACQAGRTSACPRRQIVGVDHPGLLAERVAVPARFTWPAPCSDATLACVEPLAVARSAVRRSGIRPGDACLVVGAGSQGLFLCQALLAAGVQPTVTDPHEGRMAVAEQLGAKLAEPAPAGYPFVFEASGAAAAWDTAVAAVGSTGVVVAIGMGAESVQLSTHDLVQRQLTVRGSLIYDHPGDFAGTVAAVIRGDLAPTRVVRASFPPEQAAAAFAEAPAVPGKSWIDLAAWQEGS